MAGPLVFRRWGDGYGPFPPEVARGQGIGGHELVQRTFPDNRPPSRPLRGPPPKCSQRPEWFRCRVRPLKHCCHVSRQPVLPINGSGPAQPIGSSSVGHTLQSRPTWLAKRMRWASARKRCCGLIDLQVVQAHVSQKIEASLNLAQNGCSNCDSYSERSTC